MGARMNRARTIGETLIRIRPAGGNQFLNRPWRRAGPAVPERGLPSTFLNRSLRRTFSMRFRRNSVTMSQRIVPSAFLLAGASALVQLAGCAHDPGAPWPDQIAAREAGARHSGGETSWGEPLVVRAGFSGPHAVADTGGAHLLGTPHPLPL